LLKIGAEAGKFNLPSQALPCAGYTGIISASSPMAGSTPEIQAVNKTQR